MNQSQMAASKLSSSSFFDDWRKYSVISGEMGSLRLGMLSHRSKLFATMVWRLNKFVSVRATNASFLFSIPCSKSFGVRASLTSVVEVGTYLGKHGFVFEVGHCNPTECQRFYAPLQLSNRYLCLARFPRAFGRMGEEFRLIFQQQEFQPLLFRIRNGDVFLLIWPIGVPLGSIGDCCKIQPLIRVDPSDFPEPCRYPLDAAKQCVN